MPGPGIAGVFLEADVAEEQQDESEVGSGYPWLQSLLWKRRVESFGFSATSVIREERVRVYVDTGRLFTRKLM